MPLRGPILGRAGRRAGRGLLAVGLLAVVCAGCTPWGEPTWIAHWERRTSELRGLPFLRPVDFHWIERSELRDLLQRELQGSHSQAEIDAYRDAYAAMGLLPVDLDLMESLLEMLGDQLVGLYSSRHRALYVVRDVEQRLPDSSEMIVIHELVHALQHQHFPAILDLLQGLRHNDDVVLALGAVVEGDASLTMLRSDPNVRAGPPMDPALRLQEAMLLDLEVPSGLQGHIPRLLRATQMFPYAYGTPHVARSYARTGNRSLDAQLRAPALSTVPVRFPGEDHAVEFVRLPLEMLRAELGGRGCQLGHHNVIGTVGLGVLLEDHDPFSDVLPLIRQWAGDRFVHIDCPEGWELAWLVRWTQAAAARKFARRYRALAEGLSAPLTGAPRVFVRGRTVLVLTPGLVELRGELFEQSEVRSYSTFEEWRADDCFPESPCPYASGSVP